MDRRSITPWAALACMLIVAIPFVLRLWLLQTRGYNPDELEHLHWSWCVWSGLLPYVDYFDHHTPWLHFFLSPWFALYDVGRVADDAIAFITLGRRFMWVFAAGILVATFVLGKRWRDARTGLVAAVFLSYTIFFLNKSLEIRPAVPAAALLVGSVMLSLTGVRRVLASAPGAAGRLLASGLLLGAAAMFTQKVLFVGPGFAAVTLWLIGDPRLGRPVHERLRLAGVQFLGFLIPVAATLLYFTSKGALGAFVESNFLVNTRWPGLSAGPFVTELAARDPWFVLFCLGGLLLAAGRSFRRDDALRGEPVVFFIATSLVVTLPLHPAMSYQHFLLILPLLSLYAASFLVEVIDAGARALGRNQAGMRDAVLVAVVLALGVVPLMRFRDAFQRGNWATLQGIRYVLRNSSPFDTTLDGFTGLGMFRPQPFFHHFQYPHAFALQSESEHAEMLDALTSGRALPKLIFWSHYLREGVPPEVAAFLERHYVPSGIEPVRVRPFDNGVGWWRDDAPRQLGWSEQTEARSEHVLYDDGWRVPTTEYGMAVRRTRTRSSTLTVPIRRPRDFDVVFRAHADADAVPFGVELVVNGRSAGVLPAVARWQDYRFYVGVSDLIPGFNVFELKFSGDDGSEGRRLELAVNTLQLVPAERRATAPSQDR